MRSRSTFSLAARDGRTSADAWTTCVARSAIQRRLWPLHSARAIEATIPAIEVHILAIETDAPCEVNIHPCERPTLKHSSHPKHGSHLVAVLLTLLLGCDQTDGTILVMMPDEPRASIPFF